MSLVDDLDELDVAVDLLALHDEPAATAPDTVITSAMWSLQRDQTILAAKQTQIADEWDRRGLWRSDGSKSAAMRYARDTGLLEETARRLLRRARRLRNMPLVRAAFATGDLNVDKVDALCRGCTDGREELFADAEDRLLGDAMRLGADDLNRVMTRWIDAADEAKPGSRAAKDREGRFVWWYRRVDGNVELQGRLDPVAGTALTDELERLERLLFLLDWNQAKEQWGVETSVDKLPRTSAQRRADALELMAARSAASDSTARPAFTVHLDPNTLTDLATGATAVAPACAADPTGVDANGANETAEAPKGRASCGDTGPDDRESGQRADGFLCELPDGTPITPHHLLPWLSRADVERLVLDAKGRIIDLGRRSRLFRGGARRALELRDRTCTHPGCTTPATACDGDHIIQWDKGGTTTPDNGQLLCAHHHRQRTRASAAEPGEPDEPDERSKPDLAGGPGP